MFNADLALSVTMTAISTILSVVALPANLLIYANIAYEADVTQQLDWVSLFIALAVVISAIGLGMYCSYRSTSHRFNIIANKVRLFWPIDIQGESRTSVGLNQVHFPLQLDRKYCGIVLDHLFGHCDKYG